MVVTFQTKKWKNDAEYNQYLNPETLFRPSKFPKYLEAAKSAKKIEAAELDQFRAAGFEVEEPGLFDQGGSQ